MELNIYGDFSQGPWNTPKEIIAAVQSNRDEWFPGKVELRQFATSGAGHVEGAVNVWNVLCAIVRNKPERVNVFTHAMDGYIGLSGRVVKGDVIFARRDDTELSADVIDRIADVGFSCSDARTKDVTLPRVRTALGKNATMVIYACHSALDRDYLRQIARLLGVRIGGFDEEIRYYPTLSSDRKSIRWEYSVGPGKRVANFHSLEAVFRQ